MKQDACPCRRSFLMAAFCLLAVFQVAAAGKELIPAPYQSVIAHADAVYAMNGNEHRVRFCILGDAGASHGRAIAAYRLGPNGEPRRIYLDRDRGCCPWKILVCELDGDPEPEIAVGMYKATRFFPEPANRLFIFDWNGRFIFPKWLGSRLTSPLEDFAFIRGEACRS
ncbi:MAG: hypothetical protein NTW95_12980, partial [Candidatus Aminicenantes bacterium]|nr:hypothetical protein [Candidatus Aminicenantes bacterium]